MAKTADEINYHFATIGERTVTSGIGAVDPTAGLPSHVNKSFGEFSVPPAYKIASLIATLETRKASGLDGIPVRMLKDNAGPLRPPLPPYPNNNAPRQRIPFLFKGGLPLSHP